MTLPSPRSGFTLVELSIVLVIIGLLVAGVTAGQSLIQQAKIRKTITEFNTYKTAIDRFKEKFKYPPGDLPNATRYWGGTGNGNGNFNVTSGTCTGVIGTAGAKEDVKAWQHLRLAELITGSYTGDCSSNTLAAGVNLPESSAFAGGGYWLTNAGTTTYGRADSLIVALGTSSTSAAYRPYCGPIVTAKDAKSLDDKMDDGLADKGALLTLNACGVTKASSNACVNGDPGDTGSSYNLGNTDKTCRLFYFPGYK